MKGPFAAAVDAEVATIEAWDMGDGTAQIRIVLSGEKASERMMRLFGLLQKEMGKDDTDLAQQGHGGDQGAGGGG